MGGDNQDRLDKSLGDQHTMAGDADVNSLGDQPTFGDANLEDDLFEDGMERVDLSTRYTEEGVLGKGGFGEVTLALDTRLERKVAIKRIQGKAARSKTAVHRFLTEAKSIASLNHPNIVQIYDYGRSTEGPFLIMECVQGGSLLDECKEGPIELDKAVNIFSQLCEGLAKAHAASIIHRDIKPANVLMTEDGIPKLTDFGLAKDDTVDTGMTTAGAVIGTIDFMPPEQRQAAELTDHRSDLWSLAATFYQMLTGKSPKIIKFSDVPTQLQIVLGKALEDSKDDRYQSAREMKTAVADALAGKKDASRSLGEGECPRCATVNPPDRKFCRECGGSLTVTCLACQITMPIWDKACGNCGAIQVEMISTKLEGFRRQREEAESSRNACRYQQAIEFAREIVAIEDDRIAELKPWADEFLITAQTEWEQHLEVAKTKFAEAVKHRSLFDYDSAIHSLELIPEPIREPDIVLYLGELRDHSAESKTLLKTIAKRLKDRDLSGLLELVNRAVELRGDRTDLPKLRERLQAREMQLQAREIEQDKLRDEACAAANTLLNAGDAKGGLKRMQAVSKSGLGKTGKELMRRLEAIAKAEDGLIELVNASRAAGMQLTDGEEAIELYLAIESYLSLNPKHDKIISMKSHLKKKLLRDGFLKRAASGSLLRLPTDILYHLPTAVFRDKISPELWPTGENFIGMRFKLLPGGTFAMGDDENGNAKHLVTLSKFFEIAVHPVTQEQYARVMKTNPSHFVAPQKPVEMVSWKDATRFCEQLSKLSGEKDADYVYRLPTEAEWEYACQAGTDSYLADVTGVAWCCSNSGLQRLDPNDVWSMGREKAIHVLSSNGCTTHAVGEKTANAWGLYDMLGNVAEWCADWSGDYPKRGKSVTDPTGPTTGYHRVFRGGTWRTHPSVVTPSFRLAGKPSDATDFLGFRVVRQPRVC